MDAVDPAGSRTSFDVAVIGAGVVGCALARAFTLAGARVVILVRGRQEHEPVAVPGYYLADAADQMAVRREFAVGVEGLDLGHGRVELANELR